MRIEYTTHKQKQTMTTILSIGLGLMTVAVIAELIAFRRLRKQIEEVDKDSKHAIRDSRTNNIHPSQIPN